MSTYPPPIHLSTRRLTIRTVSSHEKQQYVALNALSSHLAPFHTTPQLMSTPGSHLLFIISRRPSHNSPQFQVSDGTAFGILHIPVPFDGKTVISFKAVKAAGGHGYLEEVLPKVIDYVFDTLPVRSMSIEIAEENVVTIRVVQSLGVRGMCVRSGNVRFEFERFAWKCRGRSR